MIFSFVSGKVRLALHACQEIWDTWDGCRGRAARSLGSGSGEMVHHFGSMLNVPVPNICPQSSAVYSGNFVRRFNPPTLHINSTADPSRSLLELR